MIWLFKINDVFWSQQLTVNDWYLFDTDDINFDITKYDMPLYFASANYYIMNDSNKEEVFQLRLEGINRNPARVIITQNSKIYNIIKEFYIEEYRNKKLKELGI
jgi:hypothetical protein